MGGILLREHLLCNKKNVFFQRMLALGLSQRNFCEFCASLWLILFLKAAFCLLLRIVQRRFRAIGAARTSGIRCAKRIRWPVTTIIVACQDIGGRRAVGIGIRDVLL